MKVYILYGTEYPIAKGAKDSTATQNLSDMSSDKWEAVLNSRILSNHFKELCRDFSPPYREANTRANQKKAECNRKIIFVLTQIVRLIAEEKIDAETFKNEIKKIRVLDILHLEILWYLEFFRIMTLMEFIQFHENNNNDDVIEHIVRQLFESLLNHRNNPSEIRKKLIFYYIRTVLECLRSGAEMDKTSFVQNLLCVIITNLKYLYSFEENTDVEQYIEISLLAEFFDNSQLDPSLIQLFFQKLLSGLLESSPQTIKSVFKKQEKFKNVKDKKVCHFFRTISKYCNLNFMIVQLQTKLLDISKGIDWNIMLCFITFIGMHFKDGWRDLKMLTDFLLKEAFHNNNEQLLSYVFLIARQGCFEKSNDTFPSYLQWFSSTFSTESRRPINSKKKCTLFFNFLTNIFPYDSTYYLKVHINRRPCVPADCHFMYLEYTELVKSQLSDLNVSTELGICENTTNKSAAVYDVENVLKHFERTNDILNSVFQASMFCKEYYEKKFLAELLSKFDGKKSVRHKLISKLHSLGKIPNSMFKVYKSLEKKTK